MHERDLIKSLLPSNGSFSSLQSSELKLFFLFRFLPLDSSHLLFVGAVITPKDGISKLLGEPKTVEDSLNSLLILIGKKGRGGKKIEILMAEINFTVINAMLFWP